MLVGRRALSLLSMKRQREQLRLQREPDQLAAEQQVMLDNDLVGISRTRDRIIIWQNRALSTIFGYGPEEMVGQPTRQFYVDDASYERVGKAYAELGQGLKYRAEMQMLRKDGSMVWIDLSGVQLPDGTSLWVMLDISSIKASEAEAQYRAGHDLLTGLPNRAVFQATLNRACRQPHKGQRKFAVAFIDLDGFKAVNDNHGHDAGDVLLREVAHRISDGIRTADMAARLGGDEFVLLLNDLARVEDAMPVLERLLQALRRAVSLPNGANAHVSASIGVAAFPDHAQEADELMRLADQAMYIAKHAGKNCIQVSTGG